MARYIDADKFREFLGDMRSEYNFFDDEERPRYEAYSKALLILNEYVENEPSINIVRCGECRHRITGRMGKMCIGRHPDDFCSYGDKGQ